MPNKNMIKIAVVDDHWMIRKGFIHLIHSVCRECMISLEGENGLDLQQKLTGDNQPDILLLDVNMPKMDGFATVEWLKETYPTIKVIIITMVEKEEAIAKMYELGVKAYLSKSVEPGQLYKVLKNVYKNAKRFYYTQSESTHLFYKPAKN